MNNLRLSISNQAEVREGGALESLGKKRNLGFEAFQRGGTPPYVCQLTLKDRDLAFFVLYSQPRTWPG